LIPHNSGAERKRVNVMFDGQKVGTALISSDGTLTATITDDKVAELISPKRELRHISIDPTYKK
jgi:hypothetical protein